MTVFTILQNFIAIRQKEPCLRRKYVDFQKMLSDPCLNIAEQLALQFSIHALQKDCYQLLPFSYKLIKMTEYKLYPNFPSAMPDVPLQVGYHLNVVQAKRQGLIDKEQIFKKKYESTLRY